MEIIQTFGQQNKFVECFFYISGITVLFEYLLPIVVVVTVLPPKFRLYCRSRTTTGILDLLEAGGSGEAIFLYN